MTNTSESGNSTVKSGNGNSADVFSDMLEALERAVDHAENGGDYDWIGVAEDAIEQARHADSKVYSAAPDLLEACQDLLEIVTGFDWHTDSTEHQTIEFAREAIQKATG